jgi:hypothetical protein
MQGLEAYTTSCVVLKSSRRVCCGCHCGNWLEALWAYATYPSQLTQVNERICRWADFNYTVATVLHLYVCSHTVTGRG